MLTSSRGRMGRVGWGERCLPFGVVVSPAVADDPDLVAGDDPVQDALWWLDRRRR